MISAAQYGASKEGILVDNHFVKPKILKNEMGNWKLPREALFWQVAAASFSIEEKFLNLLKLRQIAHTFTYS